MQRGSQARPVIGRRAMLRWSGGGAAALISPALARTPRGLDPQSLASLAARLRGRLIRPGEPGYDAARRVLAAKVDPRPAAIVRVANVDDVRRVVEHAARAGLPLAIKGGGHSNAGFGVADGNLTLDMSGLDAVRLLPSRDQAYVGGGARVGQVDRATTPLGLAAPMGECPTVGVPGYALGGGVGMLTGPLGLGCDSIEAADIVLPDGRLLRADSKSAPDLLWALKGGGGNFGVVTGLRLRLRDVGPVRAGQIVFEGDLRDALLAFRDFVASAPPSTSSIGRIRRSRSGRPILAVRLCDIAPAASNPALEALRHAPGVARDGIGSTSYAALQAQAPEEYDPVLDETRSGFLPHLDEGLIERFVHLSLAAPGEFEVRLSHLHGRAVAAPLGSRAFPIRRPGLDCWITSEWINEADRPKALAWLERSWAAIAPSTHGAYVNGLDGDGPERLRGAYLESYGRLARLKRLYDPANMFRFNQNIRPG